jgi:hypothetical protein
VRLGIAVESVKYEQKLWWAQGIGGPGKPMSNETSTCRLPVNYLQLQSHPNHNPDNSFMKMQLMFNWSRSEAHQ